MNRGRKAAQDGRGGDAYNETQLGRKGAPGLKTPSGLRLRDRPTTISPKWHWPNYGCTKDWDIPEDMCPSTD